MGSKQFRLFVSFFVGLFFVISIWVSPFWSTLQFVLAPKTENYAMLRIRYAFNGIDVGAIATVLNRHLDSNVTVSFSEQIQKDDFLKQRLSEALYPRRIDKNSKFRLNLNLPQLLETDDSTALPVLERSLPATEDFEIDLLALIVAVVSVVGFGLLLLALVEKLPQTGVFANEYRFVAPGFVVLLGWIAIGLLVSLATWMQLAWSWSVLKAVGSILFVVLFLYFSRRGRLFVFVASCYSALKAKAENIIFLVVGILFAYCTTSVPVSMWDGRSIWMFHAKRIFFNGMFLLKDLTNVDTEWSNAVYPEFFPAWLSHFVPVGTMFNERMASFAIPVLFLAILQMFWVVSRRRFGRMNGAVAVGVVFFLMQDFAAGAYVDQYLMLFLGLETIFLIDRKWIAVAFFGLCASMLKVEGLVFSILLVFIVFAFDCFRSRRIFWRVGFVFLAFIPAAFHRGWTKYVGVSNVLAKVNWQETLAALPTRWKIMCGELPSMLGLMQRPLQSDYYIIWFGFFGILLLLLNWKFSQRPSVASKYFAYLGMFLIVFGFVSVSLINFDAAWLVYVTLNRIWFHGSFLLFLSALALASKANATIAVE